MSRIDALRADARGQDAATRALPAAAAGGEGVRQLPAPVLRLGILAPEGAMLSSIASAGDMLRVAQKLAYIRQPLETPRFERWVHASGAAQVTTAGGLQLGA